jgi:ATP/maltotriose-dependent transcriptional regulator MalT
MSIVEKRPAGPAPQLPGPLARVLVVAGDDNARILIGAVLSAAGQEPEVVLADRAALAEQRVDEAAVVIVTCDVARPAEVTALRRLLDAGADALVVEPELSQALIPTLRAVESGQSVVPRNLRAGVERPYLSHRERQVLNLVCEGRTNAEIAESLVLAESTIKSHMASIFTKFGVHSRKEAVAVFTDLNLATTEMRTTEEAGV